MILPAALLLVATAAPALAQGNETPATPPPETEPTDPYPSAPAETAAPAPPAPPPSEHEYGEALAAELFTTGRDLMAQGKFAEACPKLEESARLDARVGTLGKLAECEERTGQLVRARTHWQQALNLARVERDDRLGLAEQQFRRVDRIVPKVHVALAGKPPAGLKLRIDDLDLGAKSMAVPVPLDPGRHVVTVSAPGKKSWTATLHLQPDGKVTSLSVPALAAATVAKPTGPAGPRQDTTTPQPPQPGFSLRTAGFVAGGLSVVGLAIGAYYGVAARSKLDLSNALGCNGNVCSQTGADARNDARAAGDLSTAFFLAGGALAAGAVTLIVIGSDTGASPSMRATTGVSGFPRGGGVGSASGWVNVEGSF